MSNNKHTQDMERYIETLEQRLADAEAEANAARIQSLENEKELTQLRLDLQVLSEKFEHHMHRTAEGCTHSSKPV